MRIAAELNEYDVDDFVAECNNYNYLVDKICTIDSDEELNEFLGVCKDKDGNDLDDFLNGKASQFKLN